MNALFIIVLNLFVVNYSWPDNQVNALMKMSVYYETLCGDSKSFITEQLYPAYNAIKDYFKIEFVPYGKVISSKASGSWEFECQHGPSECWGNKVQACVLAEDRGQDAEMEFINCFLSKSASEKMAHTCSKKTGYSISNIMQCLQSGKGDDLHAKYGAITHQMFPVVKNVPIIVFNDQYNAEIDEMARSNLLQTALKIFNPKKNLIEEKLLHNGEDLLTIPRYFEKASKPRVYNIMELLYKIIHGNAINNRHRRYQK